MNISHFLKIGASICILNLCFKNKTFAQVDTNTYSTSFINSPEASGAITICDCPPGMVAVGYIGNSGAWLDEFSLLCQSLHNGILSGVGFATIANGNTLSTLYGPYIFTGGNVMVGAGLYVSSPYGSNAGFLAGITGFGQSPSYVASSGNNTSSPQILTQILGYYTNHPGGTLFVPNGNVITGMYAYNSKAYSSGVAFRYKSIRNFYSSNASVNNNNNEVDKVSIFPNPTSGIFDVELPPFSGTANIKMYDVLGNIVIDKVIEPNNHVNSFDLTNISKGIYYISIVTSEIIYNNKLIID